MAEKMEGLTQAEFWTKSELERQGFVVLRNGWPDFLVMTKDWKRGIGIEVKTRQDRVSESQRVMHSALAKFGLMTEVVYDGELSKLSLGATIPLVSVRKLKIELGSIWGQFEQHKFDAEMIVSQLQRLRDQLDRIESVLSSNT